MLRDYDRKGMHLVNVDDFESHELCTRTQPASTAAGDAGLAGTARA